MLDKKCNFALFMSKINEEAMKKFKFTVTDPQ